MEVPGLGTFYASYDNASFDAEFGIFYPSKIRINYISKCGDSSLILKESLRRRLKIKDFEAEEMIENFVANVGQKLNSSNYCRLEGIGYLISNNGELTLKDTFWKRNKYPTLTPMHI